MAIITSSVPASLPPSGTASGDLSGTYPGPTVAKVNGVAVTGTPSTGYVPTATSASAATWQAAGGSQPHTHEVLGSGTAQAVNNNAQAALNWGPTSGPDTLLNITAPSLPTIVASGIYAVQFQIYTGAFTVGGYCIGQIDLDVASEDYSVSVVSNLCTAADKPVVFISGTMYLTAGMQVKASVTNRDGVSARDFFLYALVQRVG